MEEYLCHYQVRDKRLAWNCVLSKKLISQEFNFMEECIEKQYFF